MDSDQNFIKTPLCLCLILDPQKCHSIYMQIQMHTSDRVERYRLVFTGNNLPIPSGTLMECISAFFSVWKRMTIYCHVIGFWTL